MSVTSTKGNNERTSNSTSTITPLLSPSVRASSPFSITRLQPESTLVSYSQEWSHVSSNEAWRFHAHELPCKELVCIEFITKKSKSSVLVKLMSQSTLKLRTFPLSAWPSSTSWNEFVSTQARVRTLSLLGSTAVTVETTFTVVPVAEASPPWLLLSKMR